MKTRIRLQVEEAVGHIILSPEPENKPPAFDHEAFAELDNAIDRVEKHQETLRAVIVSSTSPKHFIVGANIHTLATLNTETIATWVRTGHRIFNRLEDLPLPVFARVNGNVLGGGLELALACDFIVAGPQARFGLPEANLGLIAGQGGGWRLMRRVGTSRARELLYTGRYIDGVEAQAIGLCDAQGTTEEMDAWMATRLEAIDRMSPRSIAETKALLLAFDRTDREHACEREAAASQRLMASPDTMARLKAFFENRKK